jgi:hypothetical protein
MSVGQVTKAVYGEDGSNTIVLQGEWSQPTGPEQKVEGHIFLSISGNAKELASKHCTFSPGMPDPDFHFHGADGHRLTRGRVAEGASVTGWSVAVDCPWLDGKDRDKESYGVRVLAVTILDDSSLAVYDWEQWMDVEQAQAEG